MDHDKLIYYGGNAIAMISTRWFVCQRENAARAGAGKVANGESWSPGCDRVEVDLVEDEERVQQESKGDQNGCRWSGLRFPWLGVFPTTIPTKERDGIHHNVALDRKGGKAEEAEEGHFENF